MSGPPAPAVSIVLPSWNTRTDVVDFLDSVAGQDYPLDCIEVIIADNGSTDGSQAAIREWFDAHRADGWKGLILVELPVNEGIAAGYNAAYARVSAGAFAVLRAESDVVFDRGLVRTLVQALLTDSQIGIVGAKGALHHRPDLLDHAARHMNWWTGLPWDEDSRVRVDCDCVFGSTFIIRHSALRRLDTFFPPDRFLASELDICTRIKRLGLRVVYEPAAVSYHKVAHSTRRLDSAKFGYIEYRERVILNLQLNRAYRLPAFLLYTLALSAKRAARGNMLCLRGVLDGIRTAWTGSSVGPGGVCTSPRALAAWLATPDSGRER